MDAILERSTQAEDEHLSVVCCFFYFLIICLYISFNEFKGVKSFRGHIFNVGFRGEFFINCDSEILCIFSGFQFNVVKFIWKDYWFFLFCYTNHFTFIRIKFHRPV